jgi:putative ABC transport system permease protein
MDILETLKLSFEAIKLNKLRSVLTSLGIIIGVASIILLVSIGSGLSSYVSKQFEKLGTNSIFILPGKVEIGPRGGPPRSINKLTFSLVNKLEHEKGVNILEVMPVIQLSLTAENGKNSKITTLAGVNNNYFALSGLTTESGRIYTDGEDNSSKKVAVIGKTVANVLYKNTNPVGKKILLSKKSFTVIGVLKPQGNVGGVDIDNEVLLPLNSARVLTGADQVNEILVRTTSAKTIDAAKKDIDKILTRSLSTDDYTILTQQQLLSSILQILSVLTFALGGIAAISLIVGGVGISNIMLVSVTERTREIGLRKALGAKPQDILSQFLAEAVILSLTGGAIGLTIGYFGSLGLSTFIQTAVPLWAVALGFGFSSAVGIIFGVVPAIRASRLDPIVALRYE